MKYLILLIALVSLQAEAIPYQAIEDYEPNEIRRINTWEAHELVQFTINEVRFGIGLWPTEHPSAGTAPFAALITWTPGGWITLARTHPLWNDSLWMGAGNDKDDLTEFMWYMGELFSPAIRSYLVEVGKITIPSTNSGKVLFLMDSIKIDDTDITFDGRL
jgi:hypothetical protein